MVQGMEEVRRGSTIATIPSRCYVIGGPGLLNLCSHIANHKPIETRPVAPGHAQFSVPGDSEEHLPPIIQWPLHVLAFYAPRHVICDEPLPDLIGEVARSPAFSAG